MIAFFCQTSATAEPINLFYELKYMLAQDREETFLGESRGDGMKHHSFVKNENESCVKNVIHLTETHTVRRETR